MHCKCPGMEFFLGEQARCPQGRVPEAECGWHHFVSPEVPSCSSWACLPGLEYLRLTMATNLTSAIYLFHIFAEATPGSSSFDTCRAVQLTSKSWLFMHYLFGGNKSPSWSMRVEFHMKNLVQSRERGFRITNVLLA